MAPTLFKAVALSLSCSMIVGADARSTFYDRAYRNLVKRAPPVIPSTLPTNWTSKACYTDNVGGVRTLSGAVYKNQTGMTTEGCIGFCATRGFIYAGTEYGVECYCSNKLGAGNSAANAGDCKMACSGNTTQACGAGNRLNLYMSNQTATPDPSVNPGPPGWTSAGCYVEGTTGRTLTTATAVTGGSANMTVGQCTSACQVGGFTYAGVEYGQECYCGNSFQNGGKPASDGMAGCNKVCTGNMTEFCGGGARLNVYQFVGLPTSTSTSSTPPPTSSSSSSSSVASTSPVSSTASTDSSTVTSSSSTASSTASSTITTDSSTIATATNTTATDSSTAFTATNATSFTAANATSSTASVIANSTGTDSSTVPASTNATSTATSTDPGTSSSFPSSTLSANTSTSDPPITSTTASSAPTLTTNTTTAANTSSTDIATSMPANSTSVPANTTATDTVTSIPANSTSVPANTTATDTITSVPANSTSIPANTTATDSATSVPANTTASVNMTATSSSAVDAPTGYNTSTATNMSITSTASSTASLNSTASMTASLNSSATASTLTGTSTAINPTPTSEFPPGWTYAGCYTEGQNGRAIPGVQLKDNANLTRPSCVTACAAQGYKVAGMEYGKECYCGNYIGNSGKLATADTQCSVACTGNSTQKCGGPSRLSVFSLGNLTVYPPPAVQKDNLPGSWVYTGCLQSVANGTRSFKWQLILPTTNNATTCLSACSKFGYMSAGMEYGRECYCGDDDEVAATGAQFVDESNCKIACTGNPGTVCGGLSVQSFYRWKGNPLYVWNYPQGNNAGQYKFLIGGVVVPLLTHQAVNGKVVYLEKSGTGAPNTTGAYELDLANLNNFTAAWRTMRVKTDIFCGAGVVLPDRAGRILNIGGWSLSSTFGVRLYWPDGGPGRRSYNDWQENVQKLSLQKGRWYPSAMTMVNGSVLVLGGQVGSNSAPQPSLELLPRVGPPKFLDWLNRTDPNNLYPFLAIMPSGKILCAYYNEALLMDPVTFDTVKQLPMIPGSVNAPQAGRTYPLEGTAVLLPIKAPYTEPVTVLICGGSTPGPAYATDNCVTSQPEAADSSWTIERMPSQRVISCMAALPDGTYLIANGARHGVAGFGLASNPNYNSVLYDPSKPVNQRMSVMGNTTVARLYHSEAILLQDGRVLISGSDPQSKFYPEEFRNEVWVPPYLLSGLPRPAYTITQKDWTYGQSVQITLTAGSTANIRVSMMAAEVSTHGNSMGQRTIFPAVSCDGGNTCTIVTPPRPEVCPPGWYQIFVLDGPTPSVSTWIRIGGDPGSIGNWPAFSDFSLPGVGPINGTTN